MLSSKVSEACNEATDGYVGGVPMRGSVNPTLEESARLCLAVASQTDSVYLDGVADRASKA